jgi:hypothetical protein
MQITYSVQFDFFNHNSAYLILFDNAIELVIQEDLVVAKCMFAACVTSRNWRVPFHEHAIALRFLFHSQINRKCLLGKQQFQ